ncbi:MAG TPA: EAL domain-containing protein [Candidatus Limnocylindrales bacterium]|nr:EAL domain-containing protein [Candidatus Limnocylindrales bacterium]HEU4921100.1 EAL domain-containing protein [Candidatus Limnocylindrales bacterium]
MPASPAQTRGSASGRAIRRHVAIGFVALHTFVSALIAVHGPAIQAGSGTVAVAALATLWVLVGVALIAVYRTVGRHVAQLEGERAGLQEAFDRARLDSLRDALTGLGNHRAFQEELEDQVLEARDEAWSLALLVIDVDDLKRTNDRRGHAAGDELLRAVSQIIRANMRRTDRGYRIGGDEFALLLPGCSAADAEVVGRHILAAALSGHHGRGGTFSVTIGISAFPDPSADRNQLIHHADAALYSGKRHGRTDVKVFDPNSHGMADDTRAIPELTAAVARVAEGGRLTAVYQPIYSLKSGRVIGYESLVRLADDADFPSTSSLFIAAEATRRTVEIDVASARTGLAGARPLGADTYLSLNLSPRTLESDAFSPLELLSLARNSGIDPSQLVVELTEREAVEDLDRLRASLAILRRHGVRIAADDVGAGNAGLRLLSEVDFDIIKIDLSLVRAGARHEPSEAVLRALGEMARQRNRTIVAEGIETQELLEVVLELRFDNGQGYLLGRPRQTLDAPDLSLFDLMSGETSTGGFAA